uniref:AAA family ATPase n=1 Tax=Kwoniella dejecticola CBS 10117 TaxID=1296121 RepID=A0A1A6A0X7_9TREE|nr:AAA family ATPase [Kwoniella dejecticola CBS 10117]OBR83715.1 AAA family ATPase [Kwoniella dejecticola CBS 10117]
MASAIVSLRAIPDDTGPSASRGTREIRRAHLSPDVLRTHKLVAGDWVLVKSETGSLVVQTWPRVGLEDDVVVLSSDYLSNLAKRQVDLERFKPESHSHGKASRVIIREVHKESGKTKLKAKGAEETPREKEWLRASVKEILMAVSYVRQGLRITVGDTEKTSRIYEIFTVEVSNDKPSPLEDGIKNLKIGTDKVVYEMGWKTEVVVHGQAERTTASRSGETEKSAVNGIRKPETNAIDGPIPSYINLFTPSQPPTAAYGLLGGLQPQIEQIKALLDLPMLHPSLFSMFGLTPPRGILLHGPPGTGKTALARAVASSANCSCIVVNGPELSSAYHGETEERLRGVFTEARKRSPCIVVLDEIDALCPRRDGGEGGEVERRVVATLLTLMDGMSQEDAGEDRIFVVAATNRPNSIDPALRRPGRFDREIEIGIPDANGRRQIIDIMLSRMPHSLTEEEVAAIASKTHGYVGADLSSLVRESASAAIQRWHSSSPSNGSTPTLTNADVMTVLPTIRPSAMREVFVETPTVKWSDIGGQAEVKQKLRECVEWPLTHRETFTRLGVEAPRGVLLYGPPGCSKTMTAKALATESGINFIAVKGPELLNKYVGESERAVREIFRKARAASPSIIFFDEIDALGSARSDDHTHSGVLTSLLNEMDGVEELSGVTVVAATNRPDVLDSALMRPGRLDRILYVGAPDLATRKDIFRIRLSTMAVEPGVDIDELALIAEGCSGAEVASICQDAALTAMNENLDAPFVKKSHLIHSAKTVRRRITPDMLSFFEEWRDQSGVRNA